MATTSAWLGEGNSLSPLWEISFPHSLGLLYSAFTYYTGFKVNLGDYKVMLRLAASVRSETKAENLCLAGAVALNCVGNGRILRESNVNGLWIQSAAGDVGGAGGAAYAGWYQFDQHHRQVREGDTMCGGFLGPAFGNDEIEHFLHQMGAPYERLDDQTLLSRVADELAKERSSAGFRGAWSSDRARWAHAAFSATHAVEECNP